MTAQALYVKLKKKQRMVTKIVLILYHWHRGEGKAIKRKDLLRYCRIFDDKMTDRRMRRIYSKLNICSSQDGIFWPIRPREIEGFRLYMRSKVFPQFERYNRVMKAHRRLTKHEKHEYQMELF